jgi:hypothetical protein
LRNGSTCRKPVLFLASLSAPPYSPAPIYTPYPGTTILQDVADPSWPNPSLSTSDSASPPPTATSALHPRVAVILGVDKKWHFPLVMCRALSMVPAIWWGLRCAFTFLAELLSRGHPGEKWSVEKRFRVTEVALAILWVGYSRATLRLLEINNSDGV